MTEDVRELSVGQRALWLVYRLAPDSPASNVVHGLYVAPALDPDLVRRAMAAVQPRHDLLRSRFVQTDQGPVRVVDPDLRCEVEVHDVPDLDDDALLRRCQEFGDRPLRLEQDGPLRAALLRRRTDCVLVVVIHHIATDFHSQRIVWQELAEAYGALQAGRPVELPPVTGSYDDFLARERAALSGERGERLRAYWDSVCDGATAATLPTDRPRPPVRSFRGGAFTRAFPDDLAGRLRETAAAARVTPYSVVLAAFEATMYRYTGLGEFTVGCPASLRRGRALRGVVGLLVNTIALRASFHSGTTFAEAITAASRQLADGVAHAGYPFPLVQSGRRNREPAVRVTVTLLVHQHDDDFTVERHHFAGHRIRLLDIPYDEGQFDLSVTLTQYQDGSLQAEFGYDTDLFDEATVQRLAGHFLQMLRVACTAPETVVSRAAMVDEAELADLLALGTQ
ncbi:condensation domain-containing protein [Micromonospora sp. NPDC047730]|uniref:condensation domain-containing protein n=1 Tax=Micromonospora sp. NPDC047730 TaxID=3364253 RepID=UPI003715DF83